MNSETIKILDFSVFRGRNIYSHRPVMKLCVDIGKYGTIPTREIPLFHEKLLSSFPGLRTNMCGLGYEGGFLERLQEGTLLGHVLEHVILEMQSMVGYDVRYGKTRVLTEPSVYYLVYEYQNEVCGLECGKAAVFLLNCFLEGEQPDTGDFLRYLKKISLEADLGPSAEAIVREASKRGIPVTRIGNEGLLQLGYGKNRKLIESTLTEATSCIAADISCNKQMTKLILSDRHIPVPPGKTVYSELSAVIAAKQLGFPVVVKPLDGNQGKGVSLHLRSSEEVKQAFLEASRFSSGILVEQQVMGRDYRVLVVGDRVCAVSERLPAMVAGDGVHSVKELIEAVNSDENRGEHHEKPLTKIKLDVVTEEVLKKAALTLDSVPDAGTEVRLRSNANLSTGGTAIDCTEIIHPDNKRLAVMAAKAVGIDIAGIDMVAPDISQSILTAGGAVVEVNTAPGIRMHLYPSSGDPRPVEKDIMSHLFPTPESVRFPLVSVTGTNGKTTVVRLIAHVLSETGLTVGMTTTSGTFIGGTCIDPGDHSGPRSARNLLSDRTVDCAVLETARGGILREGLGYDLADVGVVLNIAEDHLGQDGSETLEDLAFIKSLVSEAVKENGYAVFHADDPLTPLLRKRTHAKIILFARTMDPDSLPDAHILVFCDGEWITVWDARVRHRIIKVRDIPFTGEGKIACNIDNALASVAALSGLGVPYSAMEDGLRSFCDNPGRFERYRLGEVTVMLDYGHNEPGYHRAIEACSALGYQRLLGVIGMPGDRSDEAMRSVGRLCNNAFAEIYIKEDHDLRGRQPGEVASVFYDEIIGNGCKGEHLEIIHDEVDALKAALGHAKSGDLIVVFYEKREPLLDYLLSAGAIPESV